MTSDEERGAAIQARRLRHGMSVNQLYQASKVSREAINAAEAGTASQLTYSKLEAWLDQFDEETGADAVATVEGSDIVTFRLSGNFGVDIAVSGPVTDIETLEASVRRLIRGMGQDEK